MQAPTTPSGPPAQEPAQRVCPGCGAENGQLAAFCWQCYQQFGIAPRAVPAAAGNGTWVPRAPSPGLRSPFPAPSIETQPGPTPRRSLGGMAGVLGGMLAVAVGVFLFTSRGASAALPDAFGSLSRVQDPQVEKLLDTFRDQAASEGINADMGVYGVAGGAPTALLAWVDGGDVSSEQDAWSQFVDGFNSGLGTGSLDEGRKTSQVVDGVTYQCAPISGTPSGTVCMWKDADVYWILFDLSGSEPEASRSLAVSAHDAS